MATRRRAGRGPVQALPAPKNERHVEKIVAALIGLGVGHLVLYLFLTSDARSALHAIESQHAPQALVTAKAPGAMPEPGTPDYSDWLGRYEVHHAAREHALHARHEGLMRYGMLFSFLIAAGILGSAIRTYARTQKRVQQPTRRARAVKPARAAPVAPVLQHPQRRQYRRSA